MSESINYVKKAKIALLEEQDKEIEEILNSPSICVFKGTIYGVGNTYKESLKEAYPLLLEEGFTEEEIKDNIFCYAASPSLIQKVEEEGGDTLFITKGSRAFLPSE